MKIETERINLILHNSIYNNYLEKNSKYEKDRVFCLHDLRHFLDVARIAYILNLERNLGIKKDVIYAAALLHDIGRWRQYKDGTPHHTASAELSAEILEEADFHEGEIKAIIDDIEYHKGEKEDIRADINTLRGIIYYSDKKSRNCFSCNASPECNWRDDMKNQGIEY